MYRFSSKKIKKKRLANLRFFQFCRSVYVHIIFFYINYFLAILIRFFEYLSMICFPRSATEIRPLHKQAKI